MPIVSVVVPFYNQARYLEQSVGSALSQTLSDIEVIVMDDGSLEDPAPALRKFENDPRLRILRQDNGGVAKARNAAIAASTGEFVHFSTLMTGSTRRCSLKWFRCSRKTPAVPSRIAM